MGAGLCSDGLLMASDAQHTRQSTRQAGGEGGGEMLILFKSALWLAWVVVGLITLLTGDISRTSYACAWVLALVYMLLDILSK